MEVLESGRLVTKGGRQTGGRQMTVHEAPGKGQTNKGRSMGNDVGIEAMKRKDGG